MDDYEKSHHLPNDPVAAHYQTLSTVLTTFSNRLEAEHTNNNNKNGVVDRVIQDMKNEASKAKSKLDAHVTEKKKRGDKKKKQKADEPVCQSLCPGRVCTGATAVGCEICDRLSSFNWATMLGHNADALCSFIKDIGQLYAKLVAEVATVKGKRKPPSSPSEDDDTSSVCSASSSSSPERVVSSSSSSSSSSPKKKKKIDDSALRCSAEISLGGDEGGGGTEEEKKRKSLKLRLFFSPETLVDNRDGGDLGGFFVEPSEFAVLFQLDNRSRTELRRYLPIGVSYVALKDAYAFMKKKTATKRTMTLLKRLSDCMTNGELRSSLLNLMPY